MVVHDRHDRCEALPIGNEGGEDDGGYHPLDVTLPAMLATRAAQIKGSPQGESVIRDELQIWLAGNRYSFRREE